MNYDERFCHYLFSSLSHMQTVRVSVTRNRLATTRLDYYLLCIISGWSMANTIYDSYLNIMTNCLIETIDYSPCLDATIFVQHFPHGLC